MTVIRNLVNNAIKFLPKGKTLSIKPERNVGVIHREICNQGIGLGLEMIQDLLSGASPTSRPGAAGEVVTGFGLKISLACLNKMSVNMKINSTIGPGSCFKVLLLIVP